MPRKTETGTVIGVPAPIKKGRGQAMRPQVSLKPGATRRRSKAAMLGAAQRDALSQVAPLAEGEHDPLDDLSDAQRTAVVAYVESDGDLQKAVDASGLAPTTVRDILTKQKYRLAVYSARNIRFEAYRWRVMRQMLRVATLPEQLSDEELKAAMVEGRIRDVLPPECLRAMEYIMKMVGWHCDASLHEMRHKALAQTLVLKSAIDQQLGRARNMSEVGDTDAEGEGAAARAAPMVALNITFTERSEPGDKAITVNATADAVTLDNDD